MYDIGFYVLSIIYVIGGVVVKICIILRKKIVEEGVKLFDCLVENVEFDGEKVFLFKDDKEMSLRDLVNVIYVGGS